MENLKVIERAPRTTKDVVNEVETTIIDIIRHPKFQMSSRQAKFNGMMEITRLFNPRKADSLEVHWKFWNEETRDKVFYELMHQMEEMPFEAIEIFPTYNVIEEYKNGCMDKLGRMFPYVMQKELPGREEEVKEIKEEPLPIVNCNMKTRFKRSFIQSRNESRLKIELIESKTSIYSDIKFEVTFHEKVNKSLKEPTEDVVILNGVMTFEALEGDDQKRRARNTLVERILSTIKAMTGSSDTILNLNLSEAIIDSRCNVKIDTKKSFFI